MREQACERARVPTPAGTRARLHERARAKARARARGRRRARAQARAPKCKRVRRGAGTRARAGARVRRRSHARPGTGVPAGGRANACTRWRVGACARRRRRPRAPSQKSVPARFAIVFVWFEIGQTPCWLGNSSVPLSGRPLDFQSNNALLCIHLSTRHTMRARACARIVCFMLSRILQQPCRLRNSSGPLSGRPLDFELNMLLLRVRLLPRHATRAPAPGSGARA